MPTSWVTTWQKKHDFNPLFAQTAQPSEKGKTRLTREPLAKAKKFIDSFKSAERKISFAQSFYFCHRAASRVLAHYHTSPVCKLWNSTPTKPFCRFSSLTERHMLMQRQRLPTEKKFCHPLIASIKAVNCVILLKPGFNYCGDFSTGYRTDCIDDEKAFFYWLLRYVSG